MEKGLIFVSIILLLALFPFIHAQLPKLTNGGVISCQDIMGGSDSYFCSDTTGGGINGSEADPFWSGNQSSYYLKSNPFSFYNITTFSYSETDPFYNGNFSNLAFLNKNNTFTAKMNFTGISLSSVIPSAVCRQADGEITYNTGINTCLVSSIKYKTNLTTIPYGIDTFMNLTPYSFSFIGDPTNSKYYGLISENLTNIIPELITYESYNASSPRGIKEVSLTAFLIKIVQGHETRIANLTASNFWNDTWAGFNKTYADTLYYPKFSNPFGFYNITNFDINNYYLKSNPFSFYNSTSWNNPYVYWNSTFATFNKTYADTLYSPVSEPKAYNGSLYLSSNPSNFITNVTMNKSVSCSNIFGNPDSDFCSDATGSAGGSGANVTTTTCSGTDKVSAINNNTGAVTCSADQTGGASSNTWRNYTTLGTQTTSATTWNNIINLTTTLSSSSIYAVNCRLRTSSVIATTGEQIRINISGSVTQSDWDYNSQVSATTRTSFNSTGGNATFSDTGSAGVNIVDAAFIGGYVITNGNSRLITYELKSEVGASRVDVKEGSFCEYTKLN